MSYRQERHPRYLHVALLAMDFLIQQTPVAFALSLATKRCI
jgi:hypothetical protein